MRDIIMFIGNVVFYGYIFVFVRSFVNRMADELKERFGKLDDKKHNKK